MSRMHDKVYRLFSATHTFIKRHDLKIIADYWKSGLDNENARVEDYEAKCGAVRKVLKQIPTNEIDKVRTEMEKLVAADRLAYFAFMYLDTLEISKKFPNGCWTKNSSEGLAETLRVAKEWIERRRT